MSRDALKSALGMTSGATTEDERAIVDSLLQDSANEAGMSLEEFKDLPPPRQALIIQEIQSNIKANETDDVAADYHKSRNNMNALLDILMNAVNTAAQVVIQTEHPRAMDSLNSLANTARSVAMDLLNIQKRLAEIQNPNSGGGLNLNVSTQASVGIGGGTTTANILEMIREQAGPLQALSQGGKQWQPRPLEKPKEAEVVEVKNG